MGLYLWEPRKAFRPRGGMIDVGFNRGDFAVTVMYGLQCGKTGNPEGN